MNKSVYIESSVISYLTARPSRDLVIAGHQAVTAEWWNERRLRYDVYVSPLVVEEISAGDASAAECPDFPRFESAPPGGITAWYTMRLTALAEDREDQLAMDLASAIRAYEDRDAPRCDKWRQKFR